MFMFHKGVPIELIITIAVFMLLTSIWALISSPKQSTNRYKLSLAQIPLLGLVFKYLGQHRLILLILKTTFALIFLIIIWAGLWGTPIVERNIATSVTWNLWWTGVVIAILLTGSGWCAVCPWDTIANWLVKRSIWLRSKSNNQLKLSAPHYLKTVWPASVLFIVFTWLELGLGIVTSPLSTAMLALLMLVLAILFTALYQEKVFCRYICPVGRTVGAYSQLSPIALRPIDPNICVNCRTLECYHGSETIAPCPTKIVMGRLVENTYCTSCGNCNLSCPQKNISWQVRSPASEAIQEAQPRPDEAFFLLILLSLTLFHGITMLDSWQLYNYEISALLKDNERQLLTFTSGLVLSLIILISISGLCILVIKKSISSNKVKYKKLFSGLAFVSLPLAFSYHLAHNLNHFVRESTNWSELINNPLGKNTWSLTMMEKHLRHREIMLPEEWLFSLQALVMAVGFFIAIQVIRYRGKKLLSLEKLQLLPILVFCILITGFSLWMLNQPMIMRM